MLKRPESHVGGNGAFMSEDQLAEYLGDLRSGRAARLNGSRPAPPSRYASKRQAPFADRTSTVRQDRFKATEETITVSASRGDVAPEQPSAIDSSRYAGHPLVPEPLSFKSSTRRDRSPEKVDTLATSPSTAYVENGSRWMERQEAHSLRVALEDMDIQEEKRIHSAAQDEASQLVWNHRNSGTLKTGETGFANPDIPAKDYKAHLRKGSYTRSHSSSSLGSAYSRDSVGAKLVDSTSKPSSHDMQEIHTVPKNRTTSDDTETVGSLEPIKTSVGTRKVKSYQGLADAVAKDIANTRRRISSGGRRKPSAEKHSFPNPEDKIYEEPEELAIPEEPTEAVPVESKPVELPSHVRRNPFARVRFAQEKIERTNSAPPQTLKRFDTVEIQKNHPSQSRKPWYLANRLSRHPTTASTKRDKEDEVAVQLKDGKEIRGDDIRSATSMKRSDRSANLPQPTAVSDKPGRPIVSFQTDWKPKETPQDEPPSVPRAVEKSTSGDGRLIRPLHKPSVSALPRVPEVNLPPMPAVAVPGNIPILNLPDEDDAPSRVLPEEPDLPSFDMPLESPELTVPAARWAGRTQQGYFPPSPAIPPKSAARPLPTPHPKPAHQARPTPHHVASSPFPASRTSHFTPATSRNGALCAQCALPISGRVLSAAGERFHPECFACHQCGTNLECVAFYPEPDQRYYERVTRIQQRKQGLEVSIPEGGTLNDMHRLEEADGDESMRFFCHLDFHELFSPRCRSCKTPIEGEVVVACGAEWHVGHFFCAQCGDPFDSKTPFVEKEGYAWCLGCHTNRYSPKCHKCRKPITDMVVKALGHEWHGDCFSCMECGGGFDDGKYFLRGESDDPVCVRCEDRRLKA